MCRCVHRSNAANSATVCAEAPTPPVGGPSPGISATNGAVGDTQFIQVMLLPASNNGGSGEWRPSGALARVYVAAPEHEWLLTGCSTFSSLPQLPKLVTWPA